MNKLHRKRVKAKTITPVISAHSARGKVTKAQAEEYTNKIKGNKINATPAIIAQHNSKNKYNKIIDKEQEAKDYLNHCISSFPKVEGETEEEQTNRLMVYLEEKGIKMHPKGVLK